MENVKKQTEKSWIFLGLAAGVLVMSAGIWGLFFMNKSYSPNAKAYVDGRIETGDSEIGKAYEKFFLSEPAELIQDQKENPEKTIRILFRGLNEDVNVNEGRRQESRHRLPCLRQKRWKIRTMLPEC